MQVLVECRQSAPRTQRDGRQNCATRKLGRAPGNRVETSTHRHWSYGAADSHPDRFPRIMVAYLGDTASVYHQRQRERHDGLVLQSVSVDGCPLDASKVSATVV